MVNPLASNSGLTLAQRQAVTRSIIARHYCLQCGVGPGELCIGTTADEPQAHLLRIMEADAVDLQAAQRVTE